MQIHRIFQGAKLANFSSQCVRRDWFQKLKRIIENNACHHKETVFDHSLNMTVRLEGLLNFNNIKPSSSKLWLKNYYSFRFTNFRRRELFLLASLFHDVGKGFDGIVTINLNGETLARGHEIIGADFIKKEFSKSKIFSTEELNYIFNGA
ncbi:MAG: HD domain-containing protein [Patescibacteria group bacterium]|nr:HD domain-containing protein [Patescibacteria group bacterium]